MPKYLEEGSSDESDHSLSNYHNFTIKDKVLKEILKNVTPQILSNINEEVGKSPPQAPTQNPSTSAIGTKSAMTTVKKAKPLLSEALAYSRSPDIRPMSPSRFK